MQKIFLKVLFVILIIGFGIGWSQDSTTNVGLENSYNDNNLNYTNNLTTAEQESLSTANVLTHSVNSPKTELFNEGEFLLNFGAGYSGINDLIYGLALSKVPVFKNGAYLNMAFAQIGGSFFWVEYFDIGFDTLVGISESFRSSTDQDTRLYLIALKARLIIHYPFEAVDIYGGVSAGISVGFNTGSATHITLGWSALFGVRFRIYGDFGMYIESAFPLPWIGLGGYAKLF